MSGIKFLILMVFLPHFYLPAKIPIRMTDTCLAYRLKSKLYLREILLSIHESEVNCARAMKFRFSSPLCVSEIKLHANIQNKLRFNGVYVNNMNESRMCGKRAIKLH